MDGYITDEEQIEHLKKWWTENGKSIIGGIIIGLTAVFGWRGWQDYLITRAEAASDIYQDMIVEIRQEKNAEARKYADELLNDYSATTYAVFASFMLAKLDSDNNNLDSAISHLQWVLDNTDEDEFSHLARIRMARLHLANRNPDKALAILSYEKPGKFLSSYEELKGDSYIQKGNNTVAKSAYELALATQAPSSSNAQSILQLKLDDIGRLNP